VADSVDAIEQAWRKERPDVDSTSIGIITRIWRVGRFLDRGRAKALARLGADPTKLDALATLRRAGAPYRLTAGEMARRSLVTPGAVSQRLDKLEQERLVRREPDDADGRVVHVQLTARGRDLVDYIFAALMEQEQAVLAPFSRDERRALAVLLRRWLSWLEAGGGDLTDELLGTRDRMSQPEADGTASPATGPASGSLPRW
jgi:DNA-binding MarR family transcriptional regulator